MRFVPFWQSPPQNPELINSILPALKERHAKTGKTARILCIGGTSVTGDNALGLYTSEKIYSDMDPAVLFDPPSSIMNFFKFLPTALVNADDEGYVKTYLISPPFVYGEVDNRFVRANIQNSHCWAWSMYINPAFSRGKAGFPGKGLNKFGCVHIDDLVDIFLLVLNAENTAPHGKEGIYFASPAEFTNKELATAIGEGLVALGKTSDPTPAAYTEEELKKFLPPPMDVILGNNARCSSERSYSIGWKPKYGSNATLFENARAETARLAKAQA